MSRKVLFVVAPWLLVVSCAAPGRVSNSKAKATSTALSTALCDLDVDNYAKAFNAAFVKKALGMVHNGADTSLVIKPRVSTDSFTIRGASEERKMALRQLCQKCGAAALLKQDSLLFIEVLNRHAYCSVYTLYILNKVKKGAAYQRHCFQPVCRSVTKGLDSSLLNIQQGEFFDGYDELYVRSRRINGEFITEDISFLRYGVLEEEIF